MSGICGYINLDGQPTNDESISTMMTAMSTYGPDGSSKWIDGNASLGHLLLYNTPESLNEHMPLISKCGNRIFVCTARVDNRTELFDLIGTPHPERSAMPDGQLIFNTIEKIGKDCCNKILGDWSMAVWDKQKNELFLARDHFGITGLYYYYGTKFIAFASNLKPLLALSQIPKRLNELRLAQILTASARDGEPTCYENIFRLPPAHQLTVSNQKLEKRLYWRLEDTPPLRLKSDDEYVEMFTDILYESVKCRLRSHKPVASTLSGGLDSSTVSVIAAELLKEQGNRLQSFSHVPMFDDIDHLYPKSRFGNERPYIEAIANHSGNIDVEYLKSEHISPLQGVQISLDIHQEPGHAAANNYWINDILQTSSNNNFATLLTGQMGNGTISWNCNGYLQNLLRKGQLIKFSRQLHEWRKYHNKALWRATGSQVIKPFLLNPLLKFYKYSRSTEDPWDSYSAINPEFSRRIDLHQKLSEIDHDPTFLHNLKPSQIQLKILKPGHNLAGCLWHENGSSAGINVCDPTLDKRLLEFCTSIPEDQFFHNGIDKWLLRRAMSKKLPQEVIWNKKKGLQSSDIALRVRHYEQEFTEIVQLLQDSSLVNEYIDTSKIQQIYQETLEKEPNTQITKNVGVILIRSIMAGMFLRQLEND